MQFRQPVGPRENSNMRDIKCGHTSWQSTAHCAVQSCYNCINRCPNANNHKPGEEIKHA